MENLELLRCVVIEHGIMSEERALEILLDYENTHVYSVMYKNLDDALLNIALHAEQNFHNHHTGEMIYITYNQDGSYNVEQTNLGTFLGNHGYC